MIDLEISNIEEIGGEKEKRIVKWGGKVEKKEKEGSKNEIVVLRKRRKMIVIGEEKEEGEVVLGIIEILLKNIEEVEIGGKKWREWRNREIIKIGEEERGKWSVKGNKKIKEVMEDEVEEMEERVDMDVKSIDLIEKEKRKKNKMEMDRKEILEKNVNVGKR